MKNISELILLDAIFLKFVEKNSIQENPELAPDADHSSRLQALDGERIRRKAAEHKLVAQRREGLGQAVPEEEEEVVQENEEVLLLSEFAPRSIWAKLFGEPGLFSGAKLTGVYCKFRQST